MYNKQQLLLSRFFLIFIAGLAALGPFSVDAYLPILPDLAKDLSTDMASANLTVSTFMIGMAIGQFLGGPLSDQLGRRRIGLIGLTIFIGATALIVTANTIDQVLSLRLVQAIGGGFASVICLAQVRDVFPPEQVSKKFANIVIVILIAPMFAPVIGTLISAWGWRAIFLALVGYGVILLAIYLLLFPETNTELPEKFSAKEIYRGYWAAITKRTEGRLIGLRLALFAGFSGGVLFCYVTNAAFIFIEYFQLSKMQFSIIFGTMVVTLMVGNRVTVYLLNKHSALDILSAVNLFQVCAAIMLVLLCYFSNPSLWMILSGIAILTGCYGAMSPAASGYFISLYDKNIGAASSLNATSMFTFGGVIGGIASVLAGGQLVPIFAVMLASSLVARILLLSARPKRVRVTSD